jgi:hypothetical protein
MNELLAQAYGTQKNVDTNSGVEKTAEAALISELEKVAAAEGIDLNEFSDDDILEILNEAMGGEDTEKTASAEAPATEAPSTEGTEDEEETQVKLAEADFLGRTMAHAFYDELTSIQGPGSEKTASEKTASGRPSDAFLKTATPAEDAPVKENADPEFAKAFEDAAMERAQEIIEYLDTGSVKQSSASVDDEKLDSAITERAGELLSEAGYDVEAISKTLQEQQG